MDGVIAIGVAIVQLILGIILAIAAIYLALSILDKLTKGISEFEEVKKGNIAVALEMAGVIIATAIIIQSGSHRDNRCTPLTFFIRGGHKSTPHIFHRFECGTVPRQSNLLCRNWETGTYFLFLEMAGYHWSVSFFLSASISRFIWGKSMTSLMDGRLARSMTRRSIPIPTPPVGGIP